MLSLTSFIANLPERLYGSEAGCRIQQECYRAKENKPSTKAISKAPHSFGSFGPACPDLPELSKIPRHLCLLLWPVQWPSPPGAGDRAAELVVMIEWRTTGSQTRSASSMRSSTCDKAPKIRAAVGRDKAFCVSGDRSARGI